MFLIAMGYVTEKDVVETLGAKMGVDFVDLEKMSLDPELARLIPEDLARRYKVVPIAQDDANKLTLAMMDPRDVIATDDISLITGFNINPVIATEEAIMKSINQQYGVTDLVEVEETVKDISAQDFGNMDFEDDMDEEIALDKLKEMVDEAPIVRVVNLIISQAINDKASDIHIEPEAKSVRVRYRVDGVLHDVMSPPKHIQAPMVSRIKIIFGDRLPTCCSQFSTRRKPRPPQFGPGDAGLSGLLRSLPRYGGHRRRAHGFRPGSRLRSASFRSHGTTLHDFPDERRKATTGCGGREKIGPPVSLYAGLGREPDRPAGE